VGHNFNVICDNKCVDVFLIHTVLLVSDQMC